MRFNFKNLGRAAVAALSLAMASATVIAHEYYLRPSAFVIQPGEQVGIAHRNGMRFKGSAYPFVDQWNVRSEAWLNGKKSLVRGKDARFSHHVPGDMRMPPDWSGGYTSIYAAQSSEDKPSENRSAG